jgi:hypothetical protein
MTPQTPKSSSTVVEPDINTPLLSPKMQTKTDRETRESGSPLGHLIDREKAEATAKAITIGSVDPISLGPSWKTLGFLRAAGARFRLGPFQGPEAKHVVLGSPFAPPVNS